MGGGEHAPKEIIASRVTAGVVARARPICAYPRVARYVGSGSIDDAANFVCRGPASAIATANTTADVDHPDTKQSH